MSDGENKSLVVPHTLRTQIQIALAASHTKDGTGRSVDTDKRESVARESKLTAFGHDGTVLA